MEQIGAFAPFILIFGILVSVFLGGRAKSKQDDGSRNLDGIDSIKQTESDRIGRERIELERERIETRIQRDQLDAEREQLKRERAINDRVGELLAELERRNKEGS
jgi:FtsZ-binding cell division protein ZapB